MKILITGGCGFVGRHFAVRFLDDGHHVTCVDNLVSGIEPSRWRIKCRSYVRQNLTFVTADIRDYFKLHPNPQFDLILHLAAIVGGRLKIDGDPLAVATDLSLDSEFFNWVVRLEHKPQVLYFSSSAVYPVELQTRNNHCALSEQLQGFASTRVGMPDQTYGFAKFAGEYLAKFAVENYGLNCKIYRPFGGYGEDQSFDYPFPSIIRRIVSGENPVVVWGSGDQQRDFIHIDDIVQAVITTMGYMKPGVVLNLGTGVGLSFRELARIASDVLKKPVNIINDATKPEGVFARVADTYRLFQHWKPTIPIEEGIKRVARALTER